jgi:hypothetical protein
LFLCFEAVLGLKISSYPIAHRNCRKAPHPHLSKGRVDILKANLAKSELVLVANVNDVESLASILGSCRVSSFPMKYLGLSLGASFRAKSIWDDIVKKIEQTFGWMEDDIVVKGGRVTLIKNTFI